MASSHGRRLPWLVRMSMEPVSLVAGMPMRTTRKYRTSPSSRQNSEHKKGDEYANKPET